MKEIVMTEIVIKIPEELYKNKKGYLTTMDAHMICDAVAKGKPLPKGHGELKDVSKFDTDNLNRGFDHNFELHYGQVFLEDVENMIANGEVLVEADKGEE